MLSRSGLIILIVLSLKVT